MTHLTKKQIDKLTYYYLKNKKLYKKFILKVLQKTS